MSKSLIIAYVHKYKMRRSLETSSRSAELGEEPIRCTNSAQKVGIKIFTYISVVISERVS